MTGLIAETIGSLWLNIPAAALVVGALTWVSFGSGGDGQLHMGGSWRTRRLDSQRMPQGWKPPGSAAGTQKADARWRDKVRAPLVEHAWETLCGSIIQEVGLYFWAHTIDRRHDPQHSMLVQRSPLTRQLLSGRDGCNDMKWCFSTAVRV